MALVLGVATQFVTRAAPASRHLLYVDDCTARMWTRWNVPWILGDSLTMFTRLRNNYQKQQILSRTTQAFADLRMRGHQASCTAEVLGVSVGITPRAATSGEKKRCAKAHEKARRIAALRCSHHLKTALAATVLAPTRCWGQLFHGPWQGAHRCRM